MSFFRTRPRQLDAASREDDEARLLVRIAGGEREALAALYRAWHRRLFRFLSRQTRRQDLIEEVINDTFLVVWQKAGEFRGESRASTWVMGIAWRCMLKTLRQSGDPAVDAGAVEDWGHSPSPAEDHELHDWLDKGLARLSPEQRDALELAYGMGHSLEEIAEITGCPVSTVKARMFHARIKLGNLLRTLGGERNTS